MLILIGLEPVKQIIEFLHVPETDLQEGIDIGSTEIAKEMR